MKPSTKNDSATRAHLKGGAASNLHRLVDRVDALANALGAIALTPTLSSFSGRIECRLEEISRANATTNMGWTGRGCVRTPLLTAYGVRSKLLCIKHTELICSTTQRHNFHHTCTHLLVFFLVATELGTRPQHRYLSAPSSAVKSINDVWHITGQQCRAVRKSKHIWSRVLRVHYYTLGLSSQQTCEYVVQRGVGLVHTYCCIGGTVAIVGCLR